MIVRKSPEDLEKMRRSGLLVWKVSAELEGHGSGRSDNAGSGAGRGEDDSRRRAPGRPSRVTTCRPSGATYPFVLCTSVNEEVVHGMPSAKRVLKKGDIVSIDTGVSLDGFFGDAAITVPVGEVDEKTRQLLQVTREALELAIDQMRPGNRLVRRIRARSSSTWFPTVFPWFGSMSATASVRRLHEEPQVPNYVDRRSENPRLKEGMVLAIEPMVNAGRPETRVLADGWTAVTRDGSYSAHFEHCVAVTADGAVGADAGREGMAGAEEREQVAATVIELLPNAACRVELDSRAQVMAHAAARSADEFRSRPVEGQSFGGAFAARQDARAES